MPCRVGITTRLEARRAEWERSVVGLRNWQSFGPFASRQQAQEAEDRLAAQYGCQAHHGGATVRGPWYVYKFDYTRAK